MNKKDIIFHETDKTPMVVASWKKGTIDFSGIANPDDVFLIFKPLYKWLDLHFASNKKQLTLNFQLEYINNSFSLAILDLFRQLNTKFEEGINIEVNWFYNSNDDEMFEEGEDYGEIAKFPFKLIGFSLHDNS